ncbi:MAG: ABC transporter permease [Chloroflexi bacterium]|nr:ABC transporter permease [Chloroflexota bacterium]
MPWSLERRQEVGPLPQILAIVLALGGAFAASAALVAAAGASVPKAAVAAWLGAFGDVNALAETLLQATPILFTGLAVTLAFRARLFNIGADGQLIAGAMGAAGVCLLVGGGLPSVLLIPLVLAAALACGGLWGALPGVLKARYDANEIIVTVMLNFVIFFLLAYLLSGPWRDPASFYNHTPRLPAAARFPELIAGTRLHWGFVLALGAALAVHLFLSRTALGYEVRAVGINALAASYKGIRVARVTVVAMAASGAIAGLAGAAEVPGLHQRLVLDVAAGFGFTGIIVAMLGRLHPLGVIPAAILFGASVTATSAMQVAVNVPVAINQTIQAVVLIFLLVTDVLVRYRIRRRDARG